MTWTPYHGDSYLDLSAVDAFCTSLAAALPGWVTLTEVGRSRHDRPLWLLTLSRTGGVLSERPAFWLDAGTHAAELTGVMAALYAVSRWAEALAAGDATTCAWFSTHAVYVMPCISPDGFDAMCSGAPFLRSTLRPPKPGAVRSGLEPRDMDGDGAVRWMRWRHPAGPFVADPDLPLYMRPRTLDDDPGDAWFVCDEGEFIAWDGVAWKRASREFSVDLNRNFPGSWAPFSMFDMDGGAFAMSEPESRAVVDAFAARPTIGSGLSHHTYTGCLLTQPYRLDSPLSQADQDLMHHLATGAVEGTSYPVTKVVPDFTYDPKRAIVGVWADTMATLFGVPGYTLELWNPFAAAGLQIDKPLDFFMKPDPVRMRQLFAHFFSEGESTTAWRAFDHPQLGPVELGGIDYLRTIRNPPESLLAGECEAGFRVAERLRRALPEVRASVRQWRHGDATVVEVALENVGYLPTSGLALGAQLQATPALSVTVRCGEGASVVSGTSAVELGHLEGWGQALVGSARSAIYPSLPVQGHRAGARFVIEGAGPVVIDWIAGRAGHGTLTLDLATEEAHP